MTEKFEIGDYLYKIEKGSVQDIKIRKGKIIDIVVRKSRANDKVESFYILESTYYGSYVGPRGDYSATGGFVEALQESRFTADEKELFTKEEIFIKVQELLLD
jgi:hypothetical protein